MYRRLKPFTKTVKNRSRTEMLGLKLKLLRETIGKTSCLQGQGSYSNTKASKTENRQMGLHKIKNFCTAQKTFTKMKSHPEKEEKLFDNYTSERELIYSIYKELQKSNTKSTTNSINHFERRNTID